MFSLTSSLRYYWYREQTDMRKSFDGLCGIINGEIKLEPTCGIVFIFMNKRRNQAKLLHWNQGTFDKPIVINNNNGQYIEWAQLVMLIEGIISYNSIVAGYVNINEIIDENRKLMAENTLLKQKLAEAECEIETLKK